MRTVALMAGLVILAPGALLAADAPKPPVARKVDHVTELHGETLSDPYFWLRNKPDPEVKAYLDAENAYTDAVMKGTGALQEALYTEIVSHVKETDLSVPYRLGGWLYYSRFEKGKQYPVYCRKKSPAGPGAAEGPEQVLLDVNRMAEGEKFMAVGAFRVSDDGNLLAYTTDNTGFRQYRLQVRNLATGEILPEKVEKATSVAWAADNRTLFYGVEDGAKRSYRIFRHRLAEPVEKDALVYEEKDERFQVGVTRSTSRAFVFLAAESHTTDEWRFLPADKPEGAWTVIQAREADHEYRPDHRGDLFWIRTNSGGRNFRLVTAPVGSPGRANWKEVLPHRPGVMLQGVSVFKDFWVATEREDGLVRYKVTEFATGATKSVTFPEPAYATSPGDNREFDATAFRYRYQSLVTPESVFDFDVKAGTSALLKETEVPGYDRSLYRSERLWATARDGTRVPVSVVWRAKASKEAAGKTLKDGPFPMLLGGYGSYGVAMDPTFNPALLPLLDRGLVYGTAHVRGGGEMGKPWHDAGRMMSKKNTFTDFIDCAEELVARKVTAKDRLVVTGGSAGGLLMGAVTNMRPDLFAAVVSYVPFVDVVNTMNDETLPLTVGEFEEWGNPKIKAEYDYLKSYCPYTNLAAKAYPPILVKTSFNDSQVMYWEPAKYVAKLRTLKSDVNPLLLKTNMAGGHGGSSGRYDRYRERAFDYAFVLTELGIAK
ncbi:MAG TPA: S9 family peptidase [Thermoanaerobaculia bacterium]|nr:S9 family peptidase [Thermoanaerobaculia bacterium]